MSRIPSTGSDGTSSTTDKPRSLNDVDVNQFLELMIAELQNQDPLNPMDNQAMLEQIGMIREISSTNQLTETLSTVMAGQNLATASGLIGRKISALDTQGKNIEGIVDRVSVQEVDEETGSRIVRVHVGASDVDLKNVRGIVDAA